MCIAVLEAALAGGLSTVLTSSPITVIVACKLEAFDPLLDRLQALLQQDLSHELFLFEVSPSGSQQATFTHTLDFGKRYEDYRSLWMGLIRGGADIDD